MQVGNAYVNRHITGAIVRRQPFGGWKRSSVGRGAKTGGPGDILRFVRFRRVGDRPLARETTESYRRLWADQFGRSLDRSGLRGESNLLRYCPVSGVIMRVGPATVDADIASLRTAASITGTAVEVSGPTARGEVDVVEDDATLAGRLARARVERVRLLAPVNDAVRRAAHGADVAIDDTAVTDDGRVELACWLKEQAISRTLHRHGRLPG